MAESGVEVACSAVGAGVSTVGVSVSVDVSVLVKVSVDTGVERSSAWAVEPENISKARRQTTQTSKNTEERKNTALILVRWVFIFQL